MTEVAFITLPEGANEDAKAAIENALEPIDQAVIKFGKALGGAGGRGELFLLDVRFESLTWDSVRGNATRCGGVAPRWGVDSWSLWVCKYRRSYENGGNIQNMPRLLKFLKN